MKIKISKSKWEKVGINGKFVEDDEVHNISNVFNIILLDEEKEVSIPIEINYKLITTEYVGGYLFYKGGIEIIDLETESPFVFKNKQYGQGVFPRELSIYWDEAVALGINDVGEAMSLLEEYARQYLIKQDIKIPEKHYKDIR